MTGRSASSPYDYPRGLLTGSLVMIALGALTFVGIGVWYIIDPGAMNAGGDIVYLTPHAENEVRAIYGGLELGLGLFYVWSLFDRQRFKSALVVLGLSIGCAGLARFVGMFSNGAWEQSMLVFGASEFIGGLIAIIIAIGLRTHEMR